MQKLLCGSDGLQESLGVPTDPVSGTALDLDLLLGRIEVVLGLPVLLRDSHPPVVAPNSLLP